MSVTGRGGREQEQEDEAHAAAALQAEVRQEQEVSYNLTYLVKFIQITQCFIQRYY